MNQHGAIVMGGGSCLGLAIAKKFTKEGPFSIIICRTVTKLIDACNIKGAISLVDGENSIGF